jgi:predicted PurR-regulated permease PerM
MKNLLKIIAALAAIALGLYLIYVLRVLLVYVVISVVLSLIGQPIMQLFQKVKLGRFELPNALSALLTMLFFVLVIAGVVSLFVPLIAEQARIIAAIDTNEVVHRLEGPYQNFLQFLSQFRLSEQTYDQDFFRSKVFEMLQFSKISNLAENMFGILGNIFVALFSISFMTFFFLKDAKLFSNIMLTITPDAQEQKVTTILKNSNRLLRRYFVGILIQMTLITIILSTVLTILGVKNALLIGFLGALLNLIPYIGPIIGAVLGVTITIISHLNLSFHSELLPLIIGVAITFLCTQLIDNLVFQPFIFSNSVSAHPLEIFLIISIAGTLSGITGMIVAIPVYTLLRIIAKEFLSEYKVVNSLTRDI